MPERGDCCIDGSWGPPWGHPLGEPFLGPFLVQFLDGFWARFGVQKRLQNWSKVGSKSDQKLSHVLYQFFCNFGSVLEPKSSQKGAKIALEGGAGEVLEGQGAFLRTCIWTRFLQCFWNIRPLKRAPGGPRRLSRWLQEGSQKAL